VAERGELERHFQAASAASAEAAEASRMKDEFLATVSHELRTPLNAMLGWAQVLQSLAPEKPEKLRHGLATIVRNAKLQAQLIDDLLDVSRIIAGKMRHLVELHGGTVRAESGGIEKGATFLVDLPRADPARDETGEMAVWRPAVGTPPEAPLPPDLDGVRVLVVDDEPDAREVIGRILGDCRAEVMAVSSAAEALSALACFKPHVLVSDIGMPEQDGYALIQEVRQLPAESGGTVPAVALTAFARAEDRRRALRAGFQRHAAKPVDIRDLTLMIAGLARGLPAEPLPPN